MMMTSSFPPGWPSSSKFFIAFIFSCTWLSTYGLTGQDTSLPGGSDNGGGKTIVCSDKRALDICWEKLPPIQDHGIPSNPQAVENACKVFDSGMECVDNWTNVCLNKQEQEKLKSSVIGALDTYRFLCKDNRFRKDFLKHADCYKKISKHWDDCARKFIESLKRVDHAKDVLSLCCIRLRYLQCVSDVASHFCSANATQFLQRLAESLVRSTWRSYHPSQCASISDKNCSQSSSAQSSTSYSLLHRLLSCPGKIEAITLGNVLQTSANVFTDMGALFGELKSYFSHPLNSPPHRVPESSPDIFLISPTSGHSKEECNEAV